MTHAGDPFREELVALLDDALPAEARSRVEAHLAGCAACRQELEGLRRALRAIDGLPATAPGPGLEAAFEARFARERARGLRGVLRWLARPAPALALGGAAAALALVLVLVPGRGPSAGDELAVAQHLELVSDLEVLEQLELLEDLEAIESLGEEG
ncbi:MAG TPA: zf-HC2 domain-containing protein [Myxococcota bacterium]|nr:zf-HC2 domain-containing protein [Myxococcota bacterium]HRY93439.1 zf-HC2 domain-containing protein [Myxococcota bacterium]HSA21002.1 zf-HC2 domain-containing protein [Myxococcota bacterium]